MTGADRSIEGRLGVQGERIASLEAKMDQSLKNQEENKGRGQQHANELHNMNIKLSAIGSRLDDLVDLKAEEYAERKKLDARVDSLEGTRTAAWNVWRFVKIVAASFAAVFTGMMWFGEKIVALISGVAK